jgi:hypothetical protein
MTGALVVVGVAFVGVNDRAFGQLSKLNCLNTLMSASEASENSTGSPLPLTTRCEPQPVEVAAFAEDVARKVWPCSSGG